MENRQDFQSGQGGQEKGIDRRRQDVPEAVERRQGDRRQANVPVAVDRRKGDRRGEG